MPDLRRSAMPKSKPPRKKKKLATGAAKSRRQAEQALPPLPDRRAMEGLLAGLTGRHGDTNLEAAQEVMYDAWDAPTKQKRVALARKALRISSLCADAYVLLAEETATTLTKAINLYDKGVKAGEIALGDEAFQHDVGHFWGLLETRPYMRARCGLAQALWAAGQSDDAIAHYRDMLRLNPNDNQGVRYLLAACLLKIERDDDLNALLQEYDGDGTAAWMFTQALACYRRCGDTERSRSLVADALESNAHVPDFLLGKRKLPENAPDYITVGGEDEAATYVLDFGVGWYMTEGAVVWLAEVLPQLSKPERTGTDP